MVSEGNRPHAAGVQVDHRRLRQPASLLRRLAHWLVPPAEAKLNAGTWRAACWLGDGGQVLSSERPLPWLLLGVDDQPC